MIFLRTNLVDADLIGQSHGAEVVKVPNGQIEMLGLELVENLLLGAQHLHK
jgi:hypothetical protein